MLSLVHPARVLRLAARTLSCPTAPYREGAVMTVGLVRFFEGLVHHDADAPRPGCRDPLLRRLETRFRGSRRDLARDPFA